MTTLKKISYLPTVQPTHVRVESSQIGVFPAQSVCFEHFVVVVGGEVVVVVG